MEAESHDHRVDKRSKNPEENKLSEGENGDSRAQICHEETAAEEAKKASNRDVVIDVNGGDNGRSRNSESSKAEKVCRICHFGTDDSSGGSELIPLGCDCRGELGVSHQNCAEAWFSQKGNRLCEICGKVAKNISSNNNTEETSIFMMEWNDMRLAAVTLDSSLESSRRCKRSFFNFLLGCLVLAFVLPWFFRGFDVL